MASETRTVEGTEIKFYTVPMGRSPRWVFGGCRTGGYATIEDATMEAAAQLRGDYNGGLGQRHGKGTTGRASAAYYRKHLAPLANKGW